METILCFIGIKKHKMEYLKIFIWHRNQGCQMVCFKPKIPIWVNFAGSCNGKCWYMYFRAIWSISGLFVIFYIGTYDT
jgi:hypothetical protein